ncbi:hypothetical protein [Pseudomonas anguilliseptica]|uniref:hypothetical protein n=1 Tax=Pseudomonas anguilliseptica TaxID=53406 RepID=UPI00325A9279
MKDILNNFHLGKSTRREEIQQRMRNVQTTGSVIQEAFQAIEAYEVLTPSQKIDILTQDNSDKKYKVIRNEKSAPYVGERY